MHLYRLDIPPIIGQKKDDPSSLIHHLMHELWDLEWNKNINKAELLYDVQFVETSWWTQKAKGVGTEVHQIFLLS